MLWTCNDLDALLEELPGAYPRKVMGQFYEEPWQDSLLPLCQPADRQAGQHILQTRWRSASALYLSLYYKNTSRSRVGGFFRVTRLHPRRGGRRLGHFFKPNDTNQASPPHFKDLPFVLVTVHQQGMDIDDIMQGTKTVLCSAKRCRRASSLDPDSS